MFKKLTAIAALAVAAVTLASVATASPVAGDPSRVIDPSVASYHQAVMNAMANPEYNPEAIAAAVRIGIPLNYITH